MNEALSAAIKEAYAVAPAHKVVLHTLEIRQPGVQPSVFMVQSRQSWTALDELGNEITFKPVGFQFSLPASNEEGFKSLNIAIDNIDQRVSEFVELAKSEKVPIQVIYRPYLSDDPSGPQMDPPLVLYLKEVQINSHQVTGRATFMDLVNKKFPSQIYSRDRFPGLG